MIYTYKFLPNITDLITGNSIENNCILRKEDNAFIPKDEANTDYQAYLLWVSEGGVTEAAD